MHICVRYDQKICLTITPNGLMWVFLPILKKTRFMHTFQKILTVAIAFLFIHQVSAQDNFKRFSIDLDGGMNYPATDIEGDFNPFGQGGIRYNLSEHFGIKGEFGMGTLSSVDDDPFNRSFTNEYMRYGLKGVISVGGITNFNESGVNILFDIGVSRIHTEITDGKNLRLNTKYTEEVTSPLTSKDFSTSIGTKLQFKVGNSLAINLGGSYHMLTSDNLDWFDKDVLANTYNDRYASAHLGLSIYLGKGKKHGDFSQPGASKDVKENTKSNQKAIKNMDKKLNDTDNDGVIDEIDQDNATKEDIRVTTKGVPMDTDYDGIPDHLDDCPVTQGTKENNGCPPDSVQKKRAMEKGQPKEEAGGGEQGQATGQRDESGEGAQGGQRDGSGRDGEGIEGESKDLTKESDYPERDYSKEEVKNYPVVTLKSSSDAMEEDKFYVIGGSFAIKSNAIDFNKYLESEGFNSMILFVKEKNLFRVAFDNYETEDKARSELDQIRAKFNEKAWLLMQ